MNVLMQYALARLSEKSTWLGIIGLAISAFGLTVSPDLQTTIASAGTAVVGIIAAVVAEKK